MVVAGFAQFCPSFGDISGNSARIRSLIAEDSGFDLLVLPELALTGYEFADREEVRELAEAFGEGPAGELALELARERDAAVVIGYAERAGDKLYNASVTALPDGSLHNYRKLHLFSRETFLFDPGDAPPQVIDTPAGRVGVMVCFDWLFPETARLLALNGAQIIAHPSNLVLNYCQQAMYCRAVENAVFIVTANRVGTESRAGRTLTFTGQSQIVGPDGEMLARADPKEECLRSVEIEPSRADNKAITEYNDRLADRRVDMYHALVKAANNTNVDASVG